MSKTATKAQNSGIMTLLELSKIQPKINKEELEVVNTMVQQDKELYDELPDIKDVKRSLRLRVEEPVEIQEAWDDGNASLAGKLTVQWLKDNGLIHGQHYKIEPAVVTEKLD
jgi:hypothetical protein